MIRIYLEQILNISALGRNLYTIDQHLETLKANSIASIGLLNNINQSFNTFSANTTPLGCRLDTITQSLHTSAMPITCRLNAITQHLNTVDNKAAPTPS